jgi:hypothetical protein
MSNATKLKNDQKFRWSNDSLIVIKVLKLLFVALLTGITVTFAGAALLKMSLGTVFAILSFGALVLSLVVMIVFLFGLLAWIILEVFLPTFSSDLGSWIKFQWKRYRGTDDEE